MDSDVTKPRPPLSPLPMCEGDESIGRGGHDIGSITAPLRSLLPITDQCADDWGTTDDSGADRGDALPLASQPHSGKERDENHDECSVHPHTREVGVPPSDFNFRVVQPCEPVGFLLSDPVAMLLISYDDQKDLLPMLGVPCHQHLQRPDGVG